MAKINAPFYQRLKKMLDGHEFDRFIERRCRKFYSDKLSRPSLPPAIYLRMVLVAYFEGIDSERGSAWRAADSMPLRLFWCGSWLIRQPTIPC